MLISGEPGAGAKTVPNLMDGDVSLFRRTLHVGGDNVSTSPNVRCFFVLFAY
jgi:hypothetical protein